MNSDFPFEDPTDGRNVDEVLKVRRSAFDLAQPYLGASAVFDPLITTDDWARKAIATKNPDAATALDGSESELVWAAFRTWEAAIGSRNDSLLRTDIVFRTDSMTENRTDAADNEIISLVGEVNAAALGLLSKQRTDALERHSMQRDIARAARVKALSEQHPFADRIHSTPSQDKKTPSKMTAREKQIQRIEGNGMSPLQRARKEREIELTDRDPFDRFA